jgi:myosin-5
MSAAAAGDTAPHVYTVIQRIYTQLVRHGHSQSVLVSGESGTGKVSAFCVFFFLGAFFEENNALCSFEFAEVSQKTESTKYALHYLAFISGGSENAQILKSQILHSNLVLESFGSCLNVLSDNYSFLFRQCENISKRQFESIWKIHSASFQSRDHRWRSHH